MKKSLIFIAVISLLITLFIPNIALAQDCTVSVEPGCAGEKTTVTGKVARWTENEVGIYIGFVIGSNDTDYCEDYCEAVVFFIFDTTQDPLEKSFSVNLVAGNYMAVMWAADTYDGEESDYYCYDEIEFVVEECPEPTPEPEPEPCYCSLVVQKRDEAGHPINGAVFKVDGIEKKTVNGDARWDNLECDTTYTVREISPEKKTEGIHLGDCGERSTLRVVNKIEEEVVEEVVEEVIIPEAGLDFNFTALYAIAGLGILRILLGIERKRK